MKFIILFACIAAAAAAGSFHVDRAGKTFGQQVVVPSLSQQVVGTVGTVGSTYPYSSYPYSSYPYSTYPYNTGVVGSQVVGTPVISSGTPIHQYGNYGTYGSGVPVTYGNYGTYGASSYVPVQTAVKTPVSYVSQPIVKTVVAQPTVVKSPAVQYVSSPSVVSSGYSGYPYVSGHNYPYYSGAVNSVSYQSPYAQYQYSSSPYTHGYPVVANNVVSAPISHVH